MITCNTVDRNVFVLLTCGFVDKKKLTCKFVDKKKRELHDQKIKLKLLSMFLFFMGCFKLMLRI